MTLTSNTPSLRNVRLEDLPDGEFRDLIDRELRKDHQNTPITEQEELNAISPKLRHPAVIDRWILALEIMKQSAETQLGAKRSDLKKTYGTDSYAAYAYRLRQYHAWRAGTMRFLHSVNARLLEARALQARRNKHALKQAIESHKLTVLADDYDPTEADLALWSTIIEE